jgi:hypothetical protein
MRVAQGGHDVPSRKSRERYPRTMKLDGTARKHLREIQEGGPRVWARRMDELRAEHLR